MVRGARRLPVLRDSEAPRNRSECRDAMRPCPWVACRYHLLLDVAEDGRLYVNGRWRGKNDPLERVLDEMPETCALDVADRGPHDQAGVGDLLGIPQPVVSWVESRARGRMRELIEHPDDPYIRLAEMTPEELAAYVAELRQRTR